MTAPLAPRLGQLVRLLGSDRDGERLASLAAIDRTLKAAGLDWHAVADAVEHGMAARPAERKPWQDLASDCLRFGGRNLKLAERQFLKSMQGWPSQPSGRQWAWLNAIAAAAGARRAA